MVLGYMRVRKVLHKSNCRPRILCEKGSITYTLFHRKKIKRSFTQTGDAWQDCIIGTHQLYNDIDRQRCRLVWLLNS